MRIALRLQREINLVEAKYLRDFMTPGFLLRFDDFVCPAFPRVTTRAYAGKCEIPVQCILKRNVNIDQLTNKPYLLSFLSG